MKSRRAEEVKLDRYKLEPFRDNEARQKVKMTEDEPDRSLLSKESSRGDFVACDNLKRSTMECIYVVFVLCSKYQLRAHTSELVGVMSPDHQRRAEVRAGPTLNVENELCIVRWR